MDQLCTIFSVFLVISFSVDMKDVLYANVCRPLVCKSGCSGVLIYFMYAFVFVGM